MPQGIGRYLVVPKSHIPTHGRAHVASLEGVDTFYAQTSRVNGVHILRSIVRMPVKYKCQLHIGNMNYKSWNVGQTRSIR